MAHIVVFASKTMVAGFVIDEFTIMASVTAIVKLLWILWKAVWSCWIAIVHSARMSLIALHIVIRLHLIFSHYMRHFKYYYIN
jgi:hypothetical protein